MLKTLHRDVQSVFDRDPAARSVLEVLLCYPGLYAVWGYRLSHWLWRHRLKLLGRYVSQIMRWFTGIEIHPGATIGPGLFIDHGMGVVIGETAELGEEVTLYHTVTLGGTSLQKGKRHPTLGDRVTVGAGAKILGPIVIGSDSRVGANAVVVKSVPSNSVVVGVPGQIIARSKPHTAKDRPDLEHSLLPDLVGVTLQSLIARVDELERRVDGHVEHEDIHLSPAGIWYGDDFAI
jgi:serine O-acetyltransferase